jgi:hypothetical protein
MGLNVLAVPSRRQEAIPMHPSRPRRRPAFVVFGVSTLAALILPLRLERLPAASASPRLSDFRVASPTPEQQEDVETLRRALSDRRLSTDGIGVYALPTGDGPTTVATRVPDEFVISAVGSGVYEVTRVESAVPPIPIGQFRAASASEWARNNADCDIYSTKGFARTQCFEITQQAGDADPGRAFWQYTAEASGHSKGGRKMDRMWVERRPADGSPRQEFDGIPEPKEARNRADNCVQVSEGITISSGQPVEVGWSHSWNRMTCETYRPKMYDDEGHWATIWEGNRDVGQKDIRHVLLTMPVKTAEGALPAWIRLNGQHTR